MKLMALLTVSLFVLLISPMAYGQGFRGGSSRGFAGPITSGTAGGQHQGTIANSGPFAPARNFSMVPGAQFQNQLQIVVPPVFIPRLAGPGIVVPGLFVTSRPGFIVGSLPLRHHHRPAFFWHNPGFVILDAPYFPTTTVITQIAPGVVSEERRTPENPPNDSRTRAPGQLAPFDPTPQDVVQRILAVAELKPCDVLYDLGSGDGRIAIAAAKKYGVKAVGYEIDPGLVKPAPEKPRQPGLQKLIEFPEPDSLTVNLAPASVVTLYLSYDGNLALRPQLMQQLKPGARVVSYTFDMGEWQPKIAEDYRDAGGDH